MSPSTNQPDRHARLTRETREVLRRAASVRELADFPGAAVRRGLRPVCKEAREGHVLVEQLLVLCKDVWRSLPEAQRLRRDIADDVLARVITTCIDEFYHGGAGGDSQPAAPRPAADTPARAVGRSLLRGLGR